MTTDLHNPDSLTPEQWGESEGWRLLRVDEIMEEERGGLSCAPFSFWSPSRGWENGICYADSLVVTYRTKLTRAELRAARNLPPEPTEAPASDTPRTDSRKEELSHWNVAHARQEMTFFAMRLERELSTAQRDTATALYANATLSARCKEAEREIDESENKRKEMAKDFETAFRLVRQENDALGRENAELRERLEKEEHDARNVPLCADHAQTWFTARYFKEGDCWFCQGNEEISAMKSRAEVAEAEAKRLREALEESDSMLEFYYGRFGEELATDERKRLDALRDKNMEAMKPALAQPKP